MTTFTEAELRAAVEAAQNWGTYVTVHAYTPASIQGAIAAGVKCIEHGQLMDEATAKLMAERDIWLSIQPFPDELADAFPPGSGEWQKAQEVFAGTDNAYALAKKYKLKTAFGTDILFSQALAQRQGELLAKLVRWYTPAQALAMATGTNAQLLALSGLRSPYAGKLGVVEEGALADLLLVDGNPIEHIELVANPARNFLVIMKDGSAARSPNRARQSSAAGRGRRLTWAGACRSAPFEDDGPVLVRDGRLELAHRLVRLHRENLDLGRQRVPEVRRREVAERLAHEDRPGARKIHRHQRVEHPGRDAALRHQAAEAGSGGEVGIEVERVPVLGDLRVELDVPRGDGLGPPRPLPHLELHGVSLYRSDNRGTTRPGPT